MVYIVFFIYYWVPDNDPKILENILKNVFMNLKKTKIQKI